MKFPVLCMDCGCVTGESEVEGSTGLCGVCPRSRERLGELDDDDATESEAARRAAREAAEDFDPVAEDLDD